MNKIYILGNGGYSQELFEQMILQPKKSSVFGGFIILKEGSAYLLNNDGVSLFNYPKEASFLLGSGNKKWRKILINHFTQYYEPTLQHFPNFISPKAYVSSMSVMGIGNVFCAFSLVNANATMGNFNNFNIYSTISHDCLIKDNNILSPYSGFMGYSRAGSDNFLGANAVITPKVTLGNDNTISAGEVVFDSMSDRQFFQSGITYRKP